MIVFTFRDSCRNTVIESPVDVLPGLAMRSGALPEIAGRERRLGHVDGFDRGNSRVSRCEWAFLAVDLERVLAGLLNVHSGVSGYRARVRPRFEEQFDIEPLGRYVPVREAC